MSEICLDCVNNSRERKGKATFATWEVRLYTDYCERCKTWKPCILRFRTMPEILLYPVEWAAVKAWQAIRPPRPPKNKG